MSAAQQGEIAIASFCWYLATVGLNDRLTEQTGARSA
jgi:hypothetical protein